MYVSPEPKIEKNMPNAREKASFFAASHTVVAGKRFSKG